MTRYEAKIYADKSEDEIRMEMSKRGYNPQRIEEPAGAVYDPHKRPTNALLVFLEGSANVKVGDREYHCTAGDLLEIPGDHEQSAKVGDEGVVYLMTEVELIGD